MTSSHWIAGFLLGACAHETSTPPETSTLPQTEDTPDQYQPDPGPCAIYIECADNLIAGQALYPAFVKVTDTYSSIVSIVEWSIQSEAELSSGVEPTWHPARPMGDPIYAREIQGFQIEATVPDVPGMYGLRARERAEHWGPDGPWNTCGWTGFFSAREADETLVSFQGTTCHEPELLIEGVAPESFFALRVIAP